LLSAGHTGLTNAFLLKMSAGDASGRLGRNGIAEQHSVKIVKDILSLPECNIMERLDARTAESTMHLLVSLIYATDMAQHFEVIEEFRADCDRWGPDVATWPSRTSALKMFMKSADLSASARPLPLALEWSSRLFEEFFKQGDKERAMGLDVTPMCDRESVDVPSAQVFWIDHFVDKAMTTLSPSFPRGVIGCLLDNMHDVRAHWDARGRAAIPPFAP